MFLIGLLVVSPLWGIVSTTLYMQIWLALANALISSIGLVKGTVARFSTGLSLAVSIFGALIFSGLLHLGYWITGDLLNLGTTDAENYVYWFFAAITLISIITEVPGKIRTSWRRATVLGALQADVTMMSKTTHRSKQADA